MNEDRIIIEVEVNAGKSAEDLANVRSRMDALKDAQKTLKKEMKELQAVQLKNGQLNNEDAKTLAELNKQYANNAADLKELTAQEKVYTAQIQIATQNDRKFGDSITELGAQLAQLKAEYRSLSKEQRESAEGKAMLENIQHLDEEVKNLDYTLGDHQRNVGNYTSALLGLNGNVAKVASLFSGGLANGFKAAGAASKEFAASLLATPVGWILAAAAAIAGAFKQMGDAIERSDDLSTELAEDLAGIEVLKTRWRQAWDDISRAALGAMESIMEWAERMNAGLKDVFTLDMFGKSAEAAKSATDELKGYWADLIAAEDELQESERKYVRDHADRERDLAVLRANSVKTETYTVEQRKKMYERMAQLEEADLKQRMDNAKEAYRLIQQRATLEINTTDEMKDKVAQAYADMIKAQTDYYQGTVTISKRTNQLIKQQEAEEEAERKKRQQAAEEAARKRAEAAEKEAAALLDLARIRISLIKDERERSRAELLTNYDEQINALKKRLETEKNLTVKTRKAINDEIVLLQYKMAEDLAAFDAETIKIDEQKAKLEVERVRREAENLQKARIAAMEEGRDKELASLKLTTDQQIAELEKRASAEEATAEEIAYIQEQLQLKLAEYARKQEEINAKYREKAIKEEYDRMKARMDNELKAALLAVGENKTAAASLELEAAERMYEKIVSMDKATKEALYDSDEEYEAARLAAEENVMNARKRNAEAIKAQAQELQSVMQAMTSALSDLFEAAAGDSEQYEKFKKAMAIVDATISMATAIAQATAVSTEGDPYTMAIRIATNVAAVTAQFAALIKALKAAAIPSAPAFAGGGIVPGDSWTGDKVTAKVNSGEMILTKEQQAKLFDLIQAGVPQSGIDYRLLARAVAEGVAALPAPVLDYSEFTRFERKVRQVEKLTTL